jgi:hypothetical protein
MPPPENHPARRAPARRPGPQRGPGNSTGAARCLEVLDSVVARSLLAGLTLENAHPSTGPQAAAGADLALGQLDEIVREARDIAFQLADADTQAQPASPSHARESGPHDTS